MLQYRFPTQEELPTQIINQEDLRSAIMKAKVESNTVSTFRYFWKHEHYVYAYCRLCPARVRYRFRADHLRYFLTFFDLNHKHKDVKKIKNEAVLKFIEDLPSEMDQRNIKHLVLQQFRIPSSTYYYMYRKIRFPKLTYRELMSVLEDKQCYVQSQPWEESMVNLPNIFILVSPNMKTQFQRFGQWVCFDTTYNIVKERDLNGMKWKIGLMVGCNQFKKIVPFGLCAITNQTKDTFYKVFKAFFQIFNKVPSVIITDESPAIKGAIEELKNDNLFQGAHLLDPFHVLQNVKKNLKDKSLLKMIAELSRLQYPQEYNKQIQACFQAVKHEEDAQVLRKFIINASSYCFSQIPAVLVGPSVSDTICEKANDLLKSRLPIQRPFTTAVTKALELMEQMIEKAEACSEIQKKQAETFYSVGELRLLRWLVSKSIFHELIKQIRRVILLDIGTRTSDFCLILEEEQEYQVQMQSELFQWRCSCKYLQKSGLPCSHILRVLTLTKQRIEPYIHLRWKIDHPRTPKTRFYRGRNTRRKRG